MSQFYFSVNLDDGRTLYLAPLSDDMIAAAGGDLPDVSGYFLYETTWRGSVPDVEILAQVHSDDAAIRLSEVMGMR